MTREQLETVAKPTFVWHIIGEYKGDYDDVIDAREDLLDILEMVYNKGIEDARCIAECGYLKEIESLKIK